MKSAAAVVLLGLVALANAAQLPLVPSSDDAFVYPSADIPSSRVIDAQSMNWLNDAKHAFTAVKDGAERLFATFPSKDKGMPDITYEMIQHERFPEYRMRLRRPQLCDPDVLQYSGYLDISEDKHLFFWFFESRNKPSKSPLVMWLNGEYTSGPGCSSSTGLLFELGPCAVKNEGKTTSHNEHSWSSHANMIFLDQPVNVGYSYSEGSTINNTPDAAEDVYAFLQLFLGRFNEYSELPFHIAAESYGGRYAPLIASSIHGHNKALSLAPIPSVLPIPLESVLIGNGLTEPHTQMAAVPTFACDGPFPVYDDPEGPQCTSLRSKVPTCQRLIQSCYTYGSKLTCVPAALYCNSQLFGPFQQLGLNPYDVRKKCDRAKDGDLCYREMNWIENYMNNVTVRAELGASEDVEFKSCNMDVNQGFLFQGDGMHNSAEVIPEMLAEGIRFLIYAGNADFMCNFIGNEEWMLNLESPFQAELQKAPLVDYRTLNGKIAGKVRAAGGSKHFGAGNFTYVVVHDAGHMVPFDQPEAALDMFVRWLSDTPLTL